MANFWDVTPDILMLHRVSGKAGRTYLIPKVDPSQLF